jgi:hypothetical protein
MRDPKFGLGMAEPAKITQKQAILNNEAKVPTRARQTRRPAVKRPANIAANNPANNEIEPKIISKPKSADDELLNKLFENQG